ncbi:MAG: hypothetical protein ABJE95_27410 [Byssovorax sp.]
MLREMQAVEMLRGVVVMCEFAARHELNDIDADIKALESNGYLTVKSVERRTPADSLYRKLKETGVDKGEAEAIAWAATLPDSDRPIFISADRAARVAAAKQSVREGDVLDLVVLLVESGALSKETARTKLAPWADREQQLGRPRDLLPFEFEAAFARRRSKWI